MPPKNYTTSIKASRTVGEIQELLANMGAEAIMIEYQGKFPDRIAFRMATASGVRNYALPCNWRSVHRLLQNQTRAPRTEDHARNVAWRTVQDWVEAQMAIIELQMVPVAQVFFPYMLTDDKGTTVFQQFESSRLLKE